VKWSALFWLPLQMMSVQSRGEWLRSTNLVVKTEQIVTCQAGSVNTLCFGLTEPESWFGPGLDDTARAPLSCYSIKGAKEMWITNSPILLFVSWAKTAISDPRFILREVEGLSARRRSRGGRSAVFRSRQI